MEDRLARIEGLFMASTRQSMISESQQEGIIEDSSGASQGRWSASPEQTHDAHRGEAPAPAQTQPTVEPIQGIGNAGIVPSPCSRSSHIFSNDIVYDPGAIIDTERLASTNTQFPDLMRESTMYGQPELHIPVTPPSTTATDDRGKGPTIEVRSPRTRSVLS